MLCHDAISENPISSLSVAAPAVAKISKADPFPKDYARARRKALQNIAKAQIEAREFAWRAKAEDARKLRQQLVRSMFPDRHPPELDKAEDEREVEMLLQSL